MSLMTIHVCCSSARPSFFGRGIAAAAKWFAPTAILVFFPKCPLCLVGYIALATGIGISLTAATYFRYGLLLLCIGSLLYLIVIGFRRIFSS
jgi:hypothetical protein